MAIDKDELCSLPNRRLYLYLFFEKKCYAKVNQTWKENKTNIKIKQSNSKLNLLIRLKLFSIAWIQECANSFDLMNCLVFFYKKIISVVFLNDYQRYSVLSKGKLNLLITMQLFLVHDS